MAESPTAREAIAQAVHMLDYKRGDIDFGWDESIDRWRDEYRDVADSVIAAVGSLPLADLAVLLRLAGYTAREATTQHKGVPYLVVAATEPSDG